MLNYRWGGLLLLGLAGMAPAANLPDAKLLWEQAEARENHITYSATSESGEGKQRILLKVYQQTNPDGTWYKRIDTEVNGSVSICIINDSGYYSLYPESHEAILSDYDYSDAAVDYSEGATYTVRDGRIQGVPCYIVTRQAVSNDRQYRRFLEKIPRELQRYLSQKDLRAMYADSFPAITIRYIDKNNLFIYGVERYAPNGKLLSRLDQENVDFSPKFARDLFMVPESYKILVAKSVVDVSMLRIAIDTKRIDAQLKKERLEKSRPGWLTRMGRSISQGGQVIARGFASPWSIGTQVLFWLAVGLLALVGVAKWKQHQG